MPVRLVSTTSRGAGRLLRRHGSAMLRQNDGGLCPQPVLQRLPRALHDHTTRVQLRPANLLPHGLGRRNDLHIGNCVWQEKGIAHWPHG